MLDIHSHILPDIDDGADSPATSVAMLKAAKACGVTTLIATPHLYEATNDLTRYQMRFGDLRVCAQDIGIRLVLGFEVNYRVLAQTEPKELLRYCVQDTDCLLVELSTTLLFPTWQYYFCEMSKLLNPILVHPERYRYLQKDLDMLTEMRGYGMEIQIDAEALLHSFSAERRCAKAWLARGEVDYIASDAHASKDYRQFASAMRIKDLAIPHSGRLHRLLNET